MLNASLNFSFYLFLKKHIWQLRMHELTLPSFASITLTNVSVHKWKLCVHHRYGRGRIGKWPVTPSSIATYNIDGVRDFEETAVEDEQLYLDRNSQFFKVMETWMSLGKIIAVCTVQLNLELVRRIEFFMKIWCGLSVSTCFCVISSITGWHL